MRTFETLSKIWYVVGKWPWKMEDNSPVICLLVFMLTALCQLQRKHGAGMR
jgi:hypothetical protein